MSKRLDWIQEELEALKQAGLYNRIRTIGSAQGAWLVVDGKRVLNFCSNNYLGLANHPQLVKAAQDILSVYGVGPAAVRTIAGTLELHLELERRLARFKNVEAAITFQSGFMANLAAIPALVGKEDVIYSDELIMPASSIPVASPEQPSFVMRIMTPTHWKMQSVRTKVNTGAGWQ